MSTSVSSQGSSANQNYAGLPTSTGSSTVPPPAPSSSNVQPTLKGFFSLFEYRDGSSLTICI
jgi:hypothetical protein